MPIKDDSKNTDRSGESHISTLYNKLRINMICLIEKEIILQESRLIYVVRKDLAVTTLSTKLANRLKEYKHTDEKDLTNMNLPTKILASL
jgi:hypothetical protein